MYCKIRMGQNTIGNVMKNMAVSLSTNKKLTNHSMRKTLVHKLKKSGQPRHVIKEITGHARESSLDDYDEVDEDERRRISHIISGFNSAEKPLSQPRPSTSTSTCQLNKNHHHDDSEAPIISSQTMSSILPTVHNTPFLGISCLSNQPLQPQAQMNWSQTAALSSSHQAPVFNHCTFNVYNSETREVPQKKRRRVISDSSDDEKENEK